MSDEDLAAAVAELAGSILLAFARSALWPVDELGRPAERLANVAALSALAWHRTHDRRLSEEGDGGAGAGRRCWIVDPLDGTREFGERRKDWATQVGLARDGAPVAGAVYLPSAGLLLRSDRPPPLPRPASPLSIHVSRNRPAHEAPELARRLGGTLVPMGSVGAKVAALLAGEAEVYLHSGGQWQWDSCAPVAIAVAAGLSATLLDATRLVHGGSDPALPDLVISHPAVAHRVGDALEAIITRGQARSESA